jgi:hypothetical protein
VQKDQDASMIYLRCGWPGQNTGMTALSKLHAHFAALEFQTTPCDCISAVRDLRRMPGIVPVVDEAS